MVGLDDMTCTAAAADDDDVLQECLLKWTPGEGTWYQQCATMAAAAAAAAAAAVFSCTGHPYTYT
jgi:hypothetical protein